MRFLGAWPQQLFTSAALAVAAALLSQHPPCQERLVHQGSLPLRISDFATLSRFVPTGLYQQLYRPFALTHHLLLAAWVPGRGLVSCAILRSRHDFTGERMHLAFVRPTPRACFTSPACPGAKPIF